MENYLENSNSEFGETYGCRYWILTDDGVFEVKIPKD